MIDTEILQDIYTDHDLCGTQRRELVKVIAMIKQNRLIELPCAVGDTVWEIDECAEGFKARPMIVLSIELKENKGYVYTTYSDEHDDFAHGYGFDDFGEILFLTKEEAEAKLKELEGDKE